MTDYLWPAAVYLLLTFPIAAIWHLVLFKRVYDELGIFTREEPIIPLGILAMTIQAAIMSFAYPYFYDGSPVRDGLTFGLVMGAFMASSAVIAEVAKMKSTSLGKWLALETAYYAIQFAIVGIGIGLAFGTSVPNP